MKKKIVVISTSLRKNSNSDQLAESFAKGAREAGHEVLCISLKEKSIAYCKGCLACQARGVCAIKDDAASIAKEAESADVLVFATPIYYYGMSGQMKTLLDRLNPLYYRDYQFREIYLLATATEDEAFVPKGAESGLQGWIDCFEKASFQKTLFCGGVNDAGAINGNSAIFSAYEMGKTV